MGDEIRLGEVVNLERRAHLLHSPLVHHHDAVRDGQRLFLVVGDVDGRDAQLLLDRADFSAQRHADLGVERRERLVEQQHLRADRQRAGQRHALLLAAGELIRVAVAQPRHVDQLQHLVHALFDFLGRLSWRP